VQLPFLRQFLRDDTGQDLVEYSLLLGFFALAAIALLSGMQTQIDNVWTSINNGLRSGVSATS